MSFQLLTDTKQLAYLRSGTQRAEKKCHVQETSTPQRHYQRVQMGLRWSNLLNLLLGRRAELFSLASSQGSRHVERLHDFTVSETLVLLQLAHKVVGKSNNSFYPVPHLTITKV